MGSEKEIQRLEEEVQILEDLVAQDALLARRASRNSTIVSLSLCFVIFVFVAANAVNIAMEFTADHAHCIENVAQLFFNIRDTQAANRVRGAYWIAKFRPLAIYKVETQSHCIRNRQNIGKQYCGVQIVTAQRL